MNDDSKYVVVLNREDAARLMFALGHAMKVMEDLYPTEKEAMHGLVSRLSTVLNAAMTNEQKQKD